jgi:shikimate dehydrogenase
MKNKKRFGLIGKRLDYSFSKDFFTTKFKLEKLDASYKNIELNNLDELKEIIDTKNISGFNVTIPFKEKVIPLLDSLSKEANKTQAINCVEITSDKKWIGHNTDVIGFEKSLLSFIKNERPSALIFGTGGASKAVQFVLEKLNIEFKLVSRKKKNHELTYEELDKKTIQSHSLLINTTPLGTFPKIEDCIDIPFQFITDKHFCLDLIYNPEKTTFLERSEAQGAQIKNGLEMLEIQGEENWKIWTRQFD